MNNGQKRLPWVEPLLGTELRTLSTGSVFVPKSYTADGVLVRVGTKGVHITIAFDELHAAHGALFRLGDLSLQDLGGRPQHRSYVLAMLASAYNTHVSVKPVRITLNPVIDLEPDRALHPDQLAEQLAAQKRLSDEAEAAAINYERERLAQAGRKDLADSVQWISLENCAAGYDIRSFDAD